MIFWPSAKDRDPALVRAEGAVATSLTTRSSCSPTGRGRPGSVPRARRTQLDARRDARDELGAVCQVVVRTTSV